MWFNDIDIKLRHPSGFGHSSSVAPTRYQAALERYLERHALREVEARQRHGIAGFIMMDSGIDILTPRFRRPAAGPRQPNWHDTLLKFPYR